jgi:DNA polymerase I-like protein with 3'-5' exonuclease and polymerase domains
MSAQTAEARYVDASEGFDEIIAGPVAVDTEGYKDSPWGLSFCFDECVGHVAVAGSVGHADVGEQIKSVPLVILHNALHDLDVLAALGIELGEPDGRWTDTMVKAYLLGEEFVGLKKLAAKYLGKDRAGYRDVMWDANERIARQWLQEIVTTFPRWPGAKPPEMEKKLRLIDRMLKKQDAIDPFAPAEEIPSLRQKWITGVAREYFEDETGLVGPMPEATLDDIPRADAVAYAAEDAVDTFVLNPMLDQKIAHFGLEDVLRVDLGIIPMLRRMQNVGLKVEPGYFEDLKAFFQADWDCWQEELNRFAGFECNVKSTLDVPKLLQAKGLRGGKKTESGNIATGDKILDGIRKNPKTPPELKRAVEFVQEIREIRTLKSGFCDGLPAFLKNGVLHPKFKNTATGTGRLAAEDPNLLAFPKHSERGKLIRGGFVARPDCELGEWDLSQIELRILAIDSGDERMISQFQSGYDFHLMGAAERYGKKPEDVTKHERFTQKAINFGIVMGITEFGLLDQFLKNGQNRGTKERWNKITEEHETVTIQWTLDDCRDELKGWRSDYGQASAYLLGKHAETRRHGFVRDLWGRCRWLPDIDSDNPYFRAEAERQAQATPVQSGAQGLVRRWMISVWKRLPDLWARGIYCEPLLQIHDALLFEYTASARAEVDALVRDALNDYQWFPIPILVDSTHGQRWSDL